MIVPPSATQLVVGAAVVAQHVPRAVNVAPPFDVTFAPRVAVVLVISADVGDVTVGATTATVVNVPSAE